ncbi:hypothetical protein [uncultured Paraglaciecola sp.]|mgnify:CR=1 FL=1|jgi:hypothetical protein|uniref:hypothetical protein n=1 Tax=uncultured Paraglaciecola sp. TaxID=1765024 RepID=UPI0025E8213F|nr:hypothetical protein [uncultured Paraglaciecola sp.]
MKKVVVFDQKKSFWSDGPDLDLLNSQIQEMESDGWKLLSVTANTHLLGGIASFTLLIESPSK